MNNETSEISEQDDLLNLSREELIEAFKNSRLETVKYVNKFLEVEEKWAFTNILLKKINSIRQKKKLCDAICEGFLKLTNSQICFFCIFNQDNGFVEVKGTSSSSNKKIKLPKLIDEINLKCSEFIKSPVSVDVINDYFYCLSGKEFIILPIIYSDILRGYLLLKNEDSNFYAENINFMNIFPEHIALVLENISYYQESEKQNKRKVEFLAGISHEFKTPLNSIIGFTEIIKSKLSDLSCFEHIKNEKLQSNHLEYVKYVNNILHSSQHLLSLLEDIIDVSRSEYKALELNYSLFSPKIEIEQILVAVERMISEKKIKLDYTLVDIKIHADAKRFRQLIYNLTTNAIKFNKYKGEIFIITYVSDGRFYFEIKDTGDGISKKNYEKIFDFFSQVNRSQLKRQLGSGIGLALCKRIVDSHKGEISFNTEIKKGTCFLFNLPISKLK